jgi:transcriptional regulator with XRE-family HTH domain
MKDADLPLGARIRSLRLAAGLSQPALAEQAGIAYSSLRFLESHGRDPLWPVMRGLIRALGPALVGGQRLRYRQPRGRGGGAVRCRDCQRCIARGPAGFTTNAPAYCLTCLTRHPDVSIGERLKAHRLAAGLLQRELAEGSGVFVARIAAFESGQAVPQWQTLRKLIGVLGVGLVDVR